MFSKLIGIIYRRHPAFPGYVDYRHTRGPGSPTLVLRIGGDDLWGCEMSFGVLLFY